MGIKGIKESFIVRIDSVYTLYDILKYLKVNTDAKWNGGDEILPHKHSIDVFEPYKKATCLVLRNKTELYYDTIENFVNGDENGNPYEIYSFNGIWIWEDLNKGEI